MLICCVYRYASLVRIGLSVVKGRKGKILTSHRNTSFTCGKRREASSGWVSGKAIASGSSFPCGLGSVEGRDRDGGRANGLKRPQQLVPPSRDFLGAIFHGMLSKGNQRNHFKWTHGLEIFILRAVSSILKLSDKIKEVTKKNVFKIVSNPQQQTKTEQLNNQIKPQGQHFWCFCALPASFTLGLYFKCFTRIVVHVLP